jgi:hypothetical protein
LWAGKHFIFNLLYLVFWMLIYKSPIGKQTVSQIDLCAQFIYFLGIHSPIGNEK